MRILIVDDEILVRIGLKTIIPMADEYFEIIGEASNGLEALTILEQTPCDIVLTDIRMPHMDGLELLKSIHERWPEIKVFMLSNHNDFHYVQSALRLGAVEYIIKLEMDPSELLDKLQLIRSRLFVERQKNEEVTRLENKVNLYGREVKEKRLRDLLMRQSTEREMEELLRDFQLLSFEAPYTVAVAKIEDYDSLLDHNRFQSERLLNYTVANVVAEICKKYGGAEFVELERGQFVILKPLLDPLLLEEISHAVRTFLKLSLSFGVSVCYNKPEITKVFMEANEALEYRFYRGRGQIITYGELPETMTDMVEPFDSDIWLKRIEEHDEAGILQLISDWVLSNSKNPVSTPNALREQWIRLAETFALSLKSEELDIYSVTLHEGKYPHHVIRSAETQQDIYEWFIGWVQVFLNYKKKHGRQRWRPEIQNVIGIINDRLHLPLKVSDLAAEVGFTENYLSILFKRETGETITDCLTRIRMKKARELLKEPGMKIYEVSEQVGYADPNHFSRSFKQLEGMYPTEYRKLVSGRS
ncbi:MAG: response regulator transcription factor [Bacillota bacterium]